MNKRLGYCIVIFLLALVVCPNFVSATTLTLTESNQTFGFQNGSYLGFRDDIVFTVSLV